MILMADAAFPPAAMPHGYKAIAGYIGGHTPHVWTNAEWDRFNGHKKLPIWHTTNDVLADGFGALRRLYALAVPKGTYVAWDLEAAIVPQYLHALHDLINWAGYKLLIYGQASTLFKNPQCDGYWVGDWVSRKDGKPWRYKHAGVRATQYTSGTVYDSSVINRWAYMHRLKAW